MLQKHTQVLGGSVVTVLQNIKHIMLHTSIRENMLDQSMNVTLVIRSLSTKVSWSSIRLHTGKGLIPCIGKADFCT